MKLKPRNWYARLERTYGKNNCHTAPGIGGYYLQITEYPEGMNIAVWQPDVEHGEQIYHNAPFKGTLEEAKALAEQAYAKFLLSEFDDVINLAAKRTAKGK